MATRDAKVRLNLAAAGMASQLQQLVKQSKELEQAVEEIGDGAAKADRKVSGLFTAMKAGGAAARGTLADLGGHLKNVLGMAATLGGSLSIGAAMKEAQDVTAAYKDLAFALRLGTGEAVSWQHVQGEVQTVADRWKRSNKEVAATYAEIFSATGDLEFSRKAIDSVAMAATASGKSVQTLGNIAGTLREKFNIGADGIDNALATVLELGNKGGVSVEDMGEKLGIVGASAKMLGLEGQGGLQKIVGLLNIADDATGSFKKSLTATTGLLEQMADPEKAKNIKKALGVDVLDKSGSMKGDAIERILAKTKGKKEELAKVFGGEERKLLVALGSEFSKAFEATEGDVKTKTAAAIDAYRKSLEEAGKATFTGADAKAEAEKRLGDSQRKMQDAMNKFVMAFEKPQMIAAMDRLAESAPALADGLAKIVSFVSKNPLSSGALAVGGMAAGSFLKGAVVSISEKGIDKAGTAIAKAFSTDVAASGAWGVAGKAFVAGSAALLAYELGKAIIDAAMAGDEQKQRNLEDASATAESMAKHGTGSPAQRAAAAQDLRKQIAGMEKDGGPGVVTDFFGSYASLLGAEHPVTAHQRKLANAKKQLAALEGGSRPPPVVPLAAPELPEVVPPSGPSPEAQKIAKEVANGEPRKMVISNEQAMASAIARALQSTTLNVRTQGGGGSGSNGLPGAPGNAPGSTPKT
jgi:hypothetical protein